ncbi:hypothetical protein GWK47_019736 [Chionoecetes opilio]|uniref:HAT C-terminal dimerisation domain-containing protein n=1 Tax=Chionoecetes opilio TaxID=41210 RepID=A0A8J5CIQ4_CHIOP|nr:hypothetical protein GWK47_019736 [Chionoecetes opilio]
MRVWHQQNRTSYYGFDDQDKQVLRSTGKGHEATCQTAWTAYPTEENAYLGVLLPTLTLMRVALERMEEVRGDQALTYAKPLVRALLRQEGNREVQRHVQRPGPTEASALHPNYGMTTFNLCGPHNEGRNLPEDCKRQKRETTARTWRQWRSMRRSAPTHFSELCDQTQADQEDDRGKGHQKELLAWKRSKEWVTLFIKYNTGIPSSAAVERLFSTAGDVLRPKRACLSEDNFEYLVFLKGNLHLLKQKFKIMVSRLAGNNVANANIRMIAHFTAVYCALKMIHSS